MAMRKRRKRIPQPPIDRQGRPREDRGYWVSLLLVLAAVTFVGLALRQRHTVPGTNVLNWRHLDLNEAVTRGGVHHVDPLAMDTPAPSADAPSGDQPSEVESTPANKTEVADDYCPT